MTMRFRFTLLFASTVFVLLMVFAYLIYGRVRDNSFQVAENYLNSLVEHEWEHLDLPSHQATHHQSAPHFRNVYLRIWKEKKLIYDSFPEHLARELSVISDKEQGKLFSTVERSYQGYLYKVSGFYDATLIVEYLAVFRKALWAGGILFMIVLIPVSLFLTRLLLRPFTELAEQTTLLSADQLSFRLPNPRHQDEFGMLARNFNLLFDRLERSFNQVRNFAVSASHEIRTPLAVVIAQGERVLRHPPKDVKDCLPVFQKQLEACLKLRAIINRLFALSEIHRLKQENSKTEFCAKEVLDEVIESLQFAYSSSNKKVTLDTPRNTYLLGNKEIFTIVVSNLMENAFKYSQRSVFVKLRSQPGQICLSIEDDGPGIALKDREKVFEPFVKEPKGNAQYSQSCGLGLSIVLACIKSINGTIDLRSSVMGGLTIQIGLPWNLVSTKL